MKLALIVAALGHPVAGAFGDDPKPAAPVAEPVRPIIPDDPIYLFLNAPNDLDSFWKLINRPDRVVLDGETYRRLRESKETVGPPIARPVSIIEALTVVGRITDDRAILVMEFRVNLVGEGPDWVPIRLDGSTLSEAREGTIDLPTRIVSERGWQVELKGKGEHFLKVGLIVPVKSSVEGKRIDLAIPAVASTGIDLSVPPGILEASTGTNEKLTIIPSDGTPSGRKLQARLSPRSRLEIAWKERADPTAKLPPLLEARGDVALDIERDSILTRSTWSISSIRGTVSQIMVRIDDAEEILDLLIDNRPVLVDARREGGRSVIAVPLAEPLKPGMSRALTLSTRRPIASRGTVRSILQGYSFDQAKVQSGIVAVSRTGPLFLNTTSARGLRRIDPRTELPDSLRNRADTVLAFEFNGPPFELGLSIEPAPPRLQVEERTTITIDPRSARLQTRLDCRTSQGRVFEVRVRLPIGLDFEGAEPADVVESSQVIPIDPVVPIGVGSEVPRLLSITLSPQARESGSFSIVLKGWSAIDPSKVVTVPLFQPEVDTSRGGRFAIVNDRNVSVELPSGGDEPIPFRVDWGQPPIDWSWPVRNPGTDQTLQWFRSDSNPSSLPLRVVVRSRSIHHETTSNATIDRQGAVIVQEIAGEVAFAALAKLDLSIPRDAAEDWEVEGADRAIREPLSPEADGSRRYRLKFAREFTDSFRFRIRYRLPLVKASSNEPGGTIKLAPIRILEGVSTGRRMMIAAEPGIEIETLAKGWTAWSPPDPLGTAESGPPARIGLIQSDEKAGPVVVNVQPGPRLPLPGVVVSRLWLKTVQRADNELATSAYFWVEAHESAMVVGLEPGSVWIRAKIGSTELGEGAVELIKPDEYRIRFPASTPTGPVLVAIDYTVPASATSGGWPAPTLLGGGVIQQTVWEAQVLGTRAGVGTPSGWIDENQWRWDGWIWQRRPWQSPSELANWLTGGSSRIRLAESLEQTDRAGQHRYLFSRVGPPSPLRFSIFSRFTLLLLCSGPVLLLGLMVLSRRPPPRMVASAGLILAFGFGALVELDALILILQSSVLGLILFLTSWLIHWRIDRRTPRRPGGDLGSIVPAPPSGSAFEKAPGVGSDDSTAIRVRPISPSVADPIILTRNLGRPPDQRSTSELDLR